LELFLFILKFLLVSRQLFLQRWETHLSIVCLMRVIETDLGGLSLEMNVVICGEMYDGFRHSLNDRGEIQSIS
jgi:hypothetical protein